MKVGGFGAEPKFRGMFQEALVQRSHVQRVEKTWEALLQRRVRLNKVSETFWRRAGEALVQSQVKFNRILENRSGEGLGGFGAKRG